MNARGECRGWTVQCGQLDGPVITDNRLPLPRDGRSPALAGQLRSALLNLLQPEHITNRFEPTALPTWLDGDEYRQLLNALEAVLPLRRPSNLADSALAGKILSAVARRYRKPLTSSLRGGGRGRKPVARSALPVYVEPAEDESLHSRLPRLAAHPPPSDVTRISGRTGARFIAPARDDVDSVVAHLSSG